MNSLHARNRRYPRSMRSQRKSSGCRSRQSCRPRRRFRCIVVSVLSRRFWVGAAPSPPDCVPTCPGFFLTHSTVPSSAGALWPDRAPTCCLALSFISIDRIPVQNYPPRTPAQDQHTPDKDHKIDRRFDVPRW